MGPIEIAEARARATSDDPVLFMLAYFAGWNTAAVGADVAGYARGLTDATADAGFIEGAAAWRARTATTRDYMPGSRAHANHMGGTR
ncbi:hypothetical protein [Streptomyces scopuliridis]|uniref:hypothetical protein n=1 Tax=Streptomyces scopuliridis TaxID=452529 RepID=UPI0035D8EE34